MLAKNIFYIVYSTCGSSRDAGEWAHDGGIASLDLTKRCGGRRCMFKTVSSAMSWFVKIDLRRIYCS